MSEMTEATSRNGSMKSKSSMSGSCRDGSPTTGPRRVQQRRTKGWRKPENTVSVARPSKWGNPFRVISTECSLGGCCWAVSLGDLVVQQHVDSKHRAHELAVRFYRSWMEEHDRHDLPDPAPLRGRNLMCFCPPELPCHADVLLELANGGMR